jgi:membrane fusion protein (multidrug efflux system)
MQVKAGDPLLQVDPIPYQIAVDEARADFRQAVKDAEAASVNVRLLQQDRKAGFEAAGQKRGELNEALSASELEARARESLHAKEKETLAASKAEEPGLLALERNARDYAERFKKLAATGDIPVQDSENRDAAWQESVARLNNLKSRIGALESQVMASELAVRQAEVKVRQARRAVAEADAGVERARAALLQPEIADSTYAGLRRKVDLVAARLAQARLRLANTLVRAPMAGIVSKRTAQLGQSLVGGQPFLSITPLEFDNVWVVANLREDQAARTRLGQPVAVTIDAIPDRVFSCWVESVSGGTGSAFSLFPPDNATGNFTRIVQRLPVRLRFSEKDNPGGRVRPGMSCKVLIDTAREIRSSNRDW